jgi:hypothetical protein
MATEGPLIHDGAQTQAQANYSPTAALSGVVADGSGQFLAVKLYASTDRKTVLANSGGEAIYGILQNKPLAGQAADVGIAGVSKAVAGAAVTRGAGLMTDTSARLITATSSNHTVAFAIESAGTAGTVFTVAMVPGGGFVTP